MSNNLHPMCFAPPLTEELLTKYAKLAGDATPAVGESMEKLIDMVKHFNKTPRSKAKPETVQLQHGAVKNAKGVVVSTVQRTPLEIEEVERINEYVPWPHELKAMSDLFEMISNDRNKDLRDAAFHLHWYACELCLDREPMTNDRL